MFDIYRCYAVVDQTIKFSGVLCVIYMLNRSTDEWNFADVFRRTQDQHQEARVNKSKTKEGEHKTSMNEMKCFMKNNLKVVCVYIQCIYMPTITYIHLKTSFFLLFIYIFIEKRRLIFIKEDARYEMSLVCNKFVSSM